jgi:hypothetical protein
MLKFRTLAQSRLVQSQVSSLRRVGVLPDCSGICASGQAISAVSREPAGQTEIPVRLSTMVDKPASLGIAQRLGNLGERPSCEEAYTTPRACARTSHARPTDAYRALQMPQAKCRRSAVTDDALSPFPARRPRPVGHSVDTSKVVPCLRDLDLVGRDACIAKNELR